jgi:transcriptional regulator with XRE-family HTH domain
VTNSFRVSVGQRIRELRDAAGYRNHREFATLLDISPSELSRIERGLRNLDTVLLRRIAEKLDVSMDAFFPDDRRAMALKRQGDANDAAMADVVAWAVDLGADVDRVSHYIVGSPA